MKKLFEYLSPFLWIPLGIVIYLAYIHAISWLTYPIGAIVLIFAVLVFLGWFVFFLKNVFDFIVSIFKDDKTRDEKGFKKHF